MKIKKQESGGPASNLFLAEHLNGQRLWFGQLSGRQTDQLLLFMFEIRCLKVHPVNCVCVCVPGLHTERALGFSNQI